MADVYTPPPDSSYLLATPFFMPSDQGDRWAVSFTGNGSAILVSALSVVITLSFLCFWNLISFLAMFFDGKATRRRYVALIMLWNSNDPWFAFKELLSYAWHCASFVNPDVRGDFWYGLTFCIIALAVFGGSIAMGIVGPSLVQIGHVAPVRPSVLFYPATPAIDGVQQLQDFGLRAPAVMRALGSVEAARVTLRSRVLVSRQDFENRPDNERVIGLTYSYSLSGVELGLQGGIDLALEVEGSCITEYEWLREEPDNRFDRYNLWNDANQNYFVTVTPSEIQHAPQADFYTHPHAEEQILNGSNVSYAVLVHSAHRASIRPGSDPWYATESRNQTFDAPHNATFQIRRRRPVLSCWEQDSWRYGTQDVTSVYELKNISGIAIPTVLLEVLETNFGGGPMVVRLGNASGDSALRSRTTSPNGVIDAERSSIYDDMERLILASFVASRSIFTDATMFGQHDEYENVFTGPDGQPADGAGNFVVSNPDVQTFSLTGIISIMVIFAALLLADCAVSLLVRFHHDHQNSNHWAKKWARFHVLTAVQLFRCVYEPGAGETKCCQWSCEHPVPEEKDDIKFKVVEEKCTRNKCKGHINNYSKESCIDPPREG
ncbi:hypothetical protein DL771_005828 [Monosporascus sp. 5C6A]|nr:hypothetical protein DL771_005828 [Monosporascus sp. 5C6A]